MNDVQARLTRRSLRVLVVDDSPEDTALYLRFLRAWPEWEVHLSHASLGDEAADLLRHTQPDLMLLDYQLPDTTGIEFLREHRPTCAVIVLTGVGDEEIAVQAIQAGAQDYLVKGRLTPDGLRRSVQAAINTHALAQALADAQAQQTALLGSITDGVLQVDEQLNVRSINPAAQGLLGTGPDLAGESLLGLSWLTDTTLTAMLREGKGGSDELRTPQGTWLHARVFPGEGGSTVYLYDDTARREILNRERAHAQQLNDLYAVAAALNAARTRPEVQGTAAAAAPDLLGSTARLLLPGEPAPADLPDDARAWLRTDPRLPERGPNWRGTPFLHEQEWIGTLLLTATALDEASWPLHSTFEELLHTALVRAELHERVQQDRLTLEDRVQARTAALERSNRDLEQFAHVASHDLKEPLRTIGSFTQLLQSRYGPQLDGRAQRYLEIVVDGAHRMATLIEDVLSLSRLRARPTPPTLTDLNGLVRGVLTQLHTLTMETGGDIMVGALPTLTVNPTQFTQLFLNLIGNALKFHQPGLPPRVHLSAEQHGGTWQFTLRDNGIGVPQEYAERVFVIFQRLHSREEYAGNGIGLALCRRIVEDRGGRIWIDSTEAGGTTIHFTVPVVPPAVDPDLPAVAQPDLIPSRR